MATGIGSRLIEIVYELKDKFTAQVGKITGGMRDIEKTSADSANKLETSNKKWQASLGGISAAFSRIKVAVLGVVAVVGTFSAAIKSAITNADEIAKTADKIGLTTNALQEYRFAAGLSGLETAQLDNSVERFSRNVGEALQGTGELKDILKQYGIEVRDAEGRARSFESILNDYANAIQNAESDQERLRLAVKGFGRDGAGMVNMLKNGSAGLQELQQAARDADLVLKEGLIRNAEVINDKWDTLTQRISIKFKELALDVAQSLSNWSDYFNDEGDIGLNKLYEKRAELLQKINEIVADGRQITSRVWLKQYQDELAGIDKQIESIQQNYTALQKAQSARLSPIGVFDNESIKNTDALLEKIVKFREELQGIGKVSVIDVYQQIALIGNALRESDFQGAIQGSEKAADMLKQLKDGGQTANITLKDLARQVEELLKKAQSREALKPLVDTEQQQKELDSFRKQLEDKVGAPVQLSVDLDTSAAEIARQKLAQPIRVPIIYVPQNSITNNAGDVLSIAAQQEGGRP